MKIHPFVPVKGLFRGTAILLGTFGQWVGFSDIDIGGKVFKCDTFKELTSSGGLSDPGDKRMFG